MTASATLLSLILLCPLPQEQPAKTPDLSSPEKAAKAWAEFWLSLRGKNPFVEVMAKVERTTWPALTPDAATRQKERLAKQAQMFKGQETLSWKTKVVAIEDASGETKEITVEVTRTFNKKDWRTKKINQVTETKLHKYVFTKVGKKWLLKQVFNPCYGCDGKAVCGMCKGSGQRPGGKGDCFSCQGKKDCKPCAGEGFREEKLAEFGMQFVKASTKLAVKQDYSTPLKAAETWILLQRKKELTGSQVLSGYVKKVLKTMQPFLIPALNKKIETSLAKGEAEATKRFLEKKPKLKSLEVEDDGAAFAVIATPVGGPGVGVVPVRPDMKPTETLSRVVLKKTGAKWLVDQIQDPCHSCKGNGACQECKARPNPGGQCPLCKGTSKCRQCKGAGFTADRF